MTATANFRQMAQYIGLAICGLIVRTAFVVFGILWGIIREIVNGVFRVAIGVIVAILSATAFFGFILWLFTLNPYRHGKEKQQNGSAAMQILRGGQHLRVHGGNVHQRQHIRVP